MSGEDGAAAAGGLPVDELVEGGEVGAVPGEEGADATDGAGGTGVVGGDGASDGGVRFCHVILTLLG